MERTKLLRARMRKNWTQEQAASFVGVDVTTYRKWELGTSRPRPSSAQLLCDAYGCTGEELGLHDADRSSTALLPLSAPLIAKFAASDLTTRLMVLAFTDRCSYPEIQAKVSHILEEFDMNIHSITRREALQRIIALSLYPAVAPSAVSSVNETLHQCAISLVACQELGRGKDSGDLTLAFEGASTVLEKLKPIFDSSQHRKAATTLAAQAARLQNVLASHLEGAAPSIPYAKQAVLYSKQAGDIPEYLLALISLAHTYHSVPRYAGQALQTMEQAAITLQEQSARIPLYLHSLVYSTLAVMQAQNGKAGDVARQQATKLAFADQGYAMFVDDPLYSLIVNEAESFHHQGDQKQALVLLSQLIDSDTLIAKRALSQRGRIRVLNDLMRVSLKIQNKDLERSVHLWKTLMQDVHTLKSERRFDEATMAYDIMGALWSGDRRIKELQPLLAHW